MSTPSKIKITDVRDIPMVSPTGEVKTEVLVTYIADGSRVYQTRVPKEKSSLDQVKAVVEKEERERLKLLNQEFEVK